MLEDMRNAAMNLPDVSHVCILTNVNALSGIANISGFRANGPEPISRDDPNKEKGDGE